LLDINMPEMDGLSAFSAMQKANLNIACIVISAERDVQTFRTAISAGVQEYLTKPFTIDELQQAIQKVSAVILSKRRDTVRADLVREQREAYLKQLAEEYARTRRTDDQALEVYERLAANPKCEMRWLRILAMIYVIRQEWGKLKNLAIHLEKRVNAAKAKES